MASDDLKAYMGQFWKCLSDSDVLRIQRALSPKHSPGVRVSNPRAYLSQVTVGRSIGLDDVSPIIPQQSVLIVENINLAWVETLGVNWCIDPAFFAAYFAGNENDQDIWKDVMGHCLADQKRPVVDFSPKWPGPGNRRSQWHAAGIIEHARSTTDPWLIENFVPRKHARNDGDGWCTETRISCLAIDQKCYLILMDAPPTQPAKPSTSSGMSTKLHLPVATNRGGLVLPILFDQDCFSIYNLFVRFLTHSWLFHDTLFPETWSPPIPETLFHLLASSTWKTNLKILTRQINQIAFEDLRRPDSRVNDRLHDCREQLIFLRTHVSNARKWMPGNVMDQIKQAIQPLTGHDDFPNDMLQEVLNEAGDLQNLLMDSFHLLMSSVSVLEAKASIEQARRSERLTYLAFLYIPITFVTGIFGMNIKEINDSPLSIWVVAVVLVLTVVLTAFLFVGYVWWEKRCDKVQRR